MLVVMVDMSFPAPSLVAALCRSKSQFEAENAGYWRLSVKTPGLASRICRAGRDRPLSTTMKDV